MRVRLTGLFGVAVLLFVVALGGVLSTASLAAGTTASNGTQYVEDATFIGNSVLPDGAIAETPVNGSLAFIDPYQANYAAWGLAFAYASSGNAQYANEAWAWLHWYANHEDPSLDYGVSRYLDASGTDIPVPPDSEDAYAGTFLLAADALYRATGNGAQLASLQTGLTHALRTIEDLYNPTCLLTEAGNFSGGAGMYTLDNAEAYGGLRSAVSMFDALGKNADAAVAYTYANDLEAGIAGQGKNSLWNGSTFAWAESPPSPANPTVCPPSSSIPAKYYYPDNFAQIWPIVLGNFVSPSTPLVSSVEVQTIMSTFMKDWPEWDNPGSLVLAEDSNPALPPGSLIYTPIASTAFAVAGQPVEQQDGVDATRAYAESAGHAYPYTVADAGQALVASLAYLGSVLAPVGTLTGPLPAFLAPVTAPLGPVVAPLSQLLSGGLL